MNPVELARRYWRFFALAWLLPVVVMAFVVAQDISGTPVLFSGVFPFVIVPLMLAGTLVAGHLQRRERLPLGIFWVVWLGPMMAVWIALVFVRAAILLLLGRPLG